MLFTYIYINIYIHIYVYTFIYVSACKKTNPPCARSQRYAYIYIEINIYIYIYITHALGEAMLLFQGIDGTSAERTTRSQYSGQLFSNG